MTILDTNVLSELMRQSPDRRVVAWMDKQPRISVWITSVTVLEIRYGLRIMTGGKRHTLLLRAFEILLDKIGGRVASFDAAAAEHASDLMSARRAKGRSVDLRDTMIAGVALARHASLATRKTQHFDDISVPLLNPWSA
jgi:predicted nucleic acid-binding protein